MKTQIHTEEKNCSKIAYINQIRIWLSQLYFREPRECNSQFVHCIEGVVIKKVWRYNPQNH